ncbi:ketopantoate reductase family protein [Polycladomyces subterraneus]|uniref:2-dehydropantoate 2-reductase n=1 Tax=Polycladomyces subterraneus TaxID=1016997 RepID=A0ABT8IQ77_9BACL|nr:2-dehydropantoate 2-reductase [Polycladomyces subterraneus]MDN4594956.1 2-dehydropantoate 2-reductase [Polycladomyces subterraneus]
MRIGVWGGGALGLLWAARLATLYPETVLVTRTREQADAVQYEGIHVIGQDGDVEQIPVQAVESNKVTDSFDVIMLMVKQRDFTTAFHQALSTCTPDGVVVCWQNGVGHDAVAKETHHTQEVYGAVTTEGAWRESMTTVRHTGTGQTWMGPLLGKREDHPSSLRSFIDRVDRRWCPVALEDDIQPRIWRKLIINSVINPLTALLEIENGELLRLPDAVALIREALEEGVAVVRAKGFRLEVDDIFNEVKVVCEKTATNRSSMYQDLMRGQLTEIDWINGGIVKEGRAYGIPTPIHETLIRLIHIKEKRNRR